MTAAPTSRQRALLGFIAAYTEMLGQPPSEADMQKYLKVSPPSVHQMILRLEKQGLITREPGRPRSIRVMHAPDWPLLGVGAIPARKRVDPRERLPLSFSEREQLLLLNDVCPPPDLADRIRLAVIDNGRLVARLTLEELDELVGYVAADANHTKSRKLQKDVDNLFGRIQKVLDTHTDQDD